MKRNLLTIAIAVVALSVSSCAPTVEKATSSPTPAAGSAPTSENQHQAIMRLMNERDQAIQRGDTTAIDRIYADDYTSTNSLGVNRTKAQVIEDFKSGALKVESITSDEIFVRPYVSDKVFEHPYEDTVIVTGRTTIKGQDKGRNISGQNRFIQVYVKRNGRWQIIAYQTSRIAQ